MRVVQAGRIDRACHTQGTTGARGKMCERQRFRASNDKYLGHSEIPALECLKILWRRRSVLQVAGVGLDRSRVKAVSPSAPVLRR